MKNVSFLIGFAENASSCGAKWHIAQDDQIASLMKVHYPKVYNMTHLLALNVLLLPKDLTIIFIRKVKFSPK